MTCHFLSAPAETSARLPGWDPMEICGEPFKRNCNRSSGDRGVVRRWSWSKDPGRTGSTCLGSWNVTVVNLYFGPTTRNMVKLPIRRIEVKRLPGISQHQRSSYCLLRNMRPRCLQDLTTSNGFELGKVETSRNTSFFFLRGTTDDDPRERKSEDPF